jgi:hypothetical protein
MPPQANDYQQCQNRQCEPNATLHKRHLVDRLNSNALLVCWPVFAMSCVLVGHGSGCTKVSRDWQAIISKVFPQSPIRILEIQVPSLLQRQEPPHYPGTNAVRAVAFAAVN